MKLLIDYAKILHSDLLGRTDLLINFLKVKQTDGFGD